MNEQVETALAMSFAEHLERHQNGINGHIGNGTYEVWDMIGDEFRATWFAMPHVLCCGARAATYLSKVLGEEIEPETIRPTHYKRAVQACVDEPNNGYYMPAAPKYYGDVSMPYREINDVVVNVGGRLL